MTLTLFQFFLVAVAGNIVGFVILFSVFHVWVKLAERASLARITRHDDDGMPDGES